MDAWQSAAIALAIGFLIGAERERDGGPAGVRTFALAGLAGAGAALVHPIVLGFAVAGAAVIMAAGYLRPAVPAPDGESAADEPTESSAGRRERLSTASTIALVLTVLLGGLAVTQPAVAAGVGVATAVILLAKERLHNVIREKVTELELTDALKFFVAAFIVLPLMPHANLGPDGIVDPRRLWTFVVAVTALGWLGYVAVRLVGPERGLPAAGLAGGFVSGTATTGAMARASRDPELFRPAMAAALLASVATLVQLVLITAVADTRVAWLLTPAVALGTVVLVGEAAWLILRKPGAPLRLGPFARPGSDRTGSGITGSEDGEPDSGPPPAMKRPTRSAGVLASRRSAGGAVIEGGTVTAIDFGEATPSDPTEHRGSPGPADGFESTMDEPTRELPPARRRTPRALVGRRPFDLVPALLLTAVLTFFLVLSAVLADALGPGPAVLAISVAGLADAHAGALTAANLASQGSLTPETAVLATVAALAVNTVVKLIFAHVAGGQRASTMIAGLLAGPTVAISLGLVVTLAVAG